jgi:hypothetical protein
MGTLTTTVPATIRRLFLPRRPSYVGRFVIAVVVDSVKRMPGRRLLAHVSQERGEVPPPRTDANATPTVAMKHGRPWIGAAGVHVLPCVVERVLPPNHRVTVSRVGPRGPFNPEATARLGGSPEEAGGRHERLNPATTQTPPLRLPPFVRRPPLRDDESSEAEASQIARAGHATRSVGSGTASCW